MSVQSIQFRNGGTSSAHSLTAPQEYLWGRSFGQDHDPTRIAKRLASPQTKSEGIDQQYGLPTRILRTQTQPSSRSQNVVHHKTYSSRGRIQVKTCCFHYESNHRPPDFARFAERAASYRHVRAERQEGGRTLFDTMLETSTKSWMTSLLQTA